MHESLPRIIAAEKRFRWRAAEISRLEGFSDAVFAFAVTLLVVSLEVPKTFHELMDAMRGFVAFGICFALLVNVWFHHYRFFRRYALQTPWAVFLNSVLLFFVLFYVYPLKFLFSGILTGYRVDGHEIRVLFVIYGLGYAAVFLLLSLLYVHAWTRREQLALNSIEEAITFRTLVDHVAMVIVGLISVLLACALPVRWVGWAGYFYFAIGVYFTVSGIAFRRRWPPQPTKQAQAPIASEGKLD